MATKKAPHKKKAMPKPMPKKKVKTAKKIPNNRKNPIDDYTDIV